MSITVGPISQVSVTPTGSNLSWAAAAGGTGPYTYALYRSTVSGFTPGSGNLVATGLTGLTYADSGLIPNTTYYYEVIATDSTSATGDSAQLGVVTAPPTLSQNQFAQTPYLGYVDQNYNPNTKSCLLDPSVQGPVYCGCAVKQMNPSVPNPAGFNGPITVTPCTSDADQVFGFIQYSMKDVFFGPGQPVEVSCAGNVQYLYATNNGNAGDQAQLDLSTNGGVTSKSGSTATLVGSFLDQPVAGQLVRVQLTTPSYQTA